MKHAAFQIALLMAAGCSPSGDTGSATTPAPNYYGTDANLAPSEPDAILRYADHPRGFAELRLPPGDGPFPLAVIFHGGCWKTGIATQHYMTPLVASWQRQGIASLNVDYREVGDGGGWPGSFEDWQAASALIAELAADYPIDRERVTLVGHSAGALPAQWLAAQQGEDGPVGARDPLHARAAVIFDGPADVGAERAAFDALCRFSSVDPFMGGAPGDVPQRYSAIAPAAHPPQLHEVLFVQAVLPPAPGEAQAAIRAGGAELTVLANPGASHFEIITPGSALYREHEAAILQVLRGR